MKVLFGSTIFIGPLFCLIYVLFPSRSSVLINIYTYIYIYIYICSSIWVLFSWFTNCVLRSDDNSLIPGCFWLFGICFKQHIDTRYLVFYNPSPPRMFCPWTFFQNIGFNMVPPSDRFMSHLTTQFEYSAGEFQALQLIVLATFGVVD